MFDLFYKIKALHKAGIKIHLHCFEYGRGEQQTLNEYCEEVIYYKRKKSFPLAKFRLPYIVSSRINSLLIERLLKDNYPVLLEGIHCTFHLFNDELKNRNVLVRLHNVEFQYYSELSKSSANIYKKAYYQAEARLLKKYEKIIATKAKLIAVNEKDRKTYQSIFNANDIELLPVFLPFTEVNSLTGKGDFCLYHGNLSVAENEKAALWLLENIFAENHWPFVIAGKNPSLSLKRKIAAYKNVKLIANPSKREMENLVKNAHIHLLPSFNSTGIKIKLLNALFNGRFIITNAISLEGTGLESLCHVAENPSEYIDKIEELYKFSFSENEITKRYELLNKMYNNEKNAQQLIRWL